VNAQQTVFVVEDDARTRAAVELLLRTEGYNVRSYASAEEFLARAVDARSICLLTDFRLPGIDGLALHRRLVAAGAAPATVMITGHGDVPMAVSALKEGVIDFIEKPFHPPALLESVTEAFRRALTIQEHETKAAELKVRLRALSQREAEVLDLMVDGQPSKVIASRLGVSARTVEHHRAHIMEKLGVSSTSRLIAMISAMRMRPDA
jgi:FixJ family two-component response regulator